MSSSFSQRSRASELMDAPDAEQDPNELMVTFDELDTINRWLGGYGPSLDGIGRLLPTDRRRFSLLDVGTGGGELLGRVAHWAAARHCAVELTGLDRSAPIIDLARERAALPGDGQLEFVCADLFALPDDEHFDIVHCALMLHHLRDDAAVAALSKMASLARLGVVVNDLQRHPIAYHSIRVLTQLLSRNRLIRHDAPVSVLRAFTRPELLELVRRARLPQPWLRWRWAFRWELVIPS